MKLSSLIGLSREKQKAHVLIRSCLRTEETFPHTLFYGVGGTGKTALARAIGEELGYHFVETHAAPFKRVELLYLALIRASKTALQLDRPLLFFIDEVHRLKLVLQESLYSAMKEWWIPTSTGRQELAPFTLFGATTRLDMLDENSFVKRFENRWEIRRYPVSELAIIVAKHLSEKGYSFGRDVTNLIAQRCLGIPRTAVNLANKVRHVAESERYLYSPKIITSAHVMRAFTLEQIDELGLQPIHHRYLDILAASRSNGRQVPLGIGAIAAKMGQPEDGIKGSVEPILLELNMVAPTPRGRVLTEAGGQYLRQSKNIVAKQGSDYLKKPLDIWHGCGTLRA